MVTLSTHHAPFVACPTHDRAIAVAVAPEVVKPLVRWIGGKRWLTDALVPGIRDKLVQDGGRYIEPFLGGGALAFALGLPGMVLSDALPSLVDMYWAVTDDPVAVHAATVKIAGRVEDFSSEKYYAIRATHPETLTPVQRAARFIVLNRTGYNGLYRENAKGGYNVAFGTAVSRNRFSFPDVDAFVAVARVLNTCADDGPWCGDFREVVACATRGDVLFCDPPYLGQFASYTMGKFSETDHAELAESCRAAHTRGATVIVTQADAPETRAAYHWAHILTSQEPQRVDRRRGKKSAEGLVITTDASILSR